MAWLQIKLLIAAEQAEVAEQLCLAQGAVAITLSDAQDNPVLEPLPGETRLWQQTELVALYDESIDISTITSELQMTLLLSEQHPPTFERLADKAWEREALTNWKPICFGDRLWICPSWQMVPDPAAVTVTLDPGLAFGTGSHPTTALCLNWLAQQPLAGKRIIDFGCGSGILAIAALKLGAVSALGIDQEPQALMATRDNAEHNQVADRLQLRETDTPPTNEVADIVVANILAELLKQLAPQLSQLVLPGGWLLLSGILSSQAEAVMGAYQENFTFKTRQTEQEWCCLSAIKHPGKF